MNEIPSFELVGVMGWSVDRPADTQTQLEPWYGITGFSNVNFCASIVLPWKIYYDYHCQEYRRVNKRMDLQMVQLADCPELTDCEQNDSRIPTNRIAKSDD